MQSIAIAQAVTKPQTTEELAIQISWHPESVRRAIREGRIKAKQFGREWRIMPDEIARIMDEGLPRKEAA